MSQQFAVCLVAVAANLVGISLIYALMAHAFTHLAWRGHGIFAVIALIVLAQLFWIGPALLIVFPRDPDAASSCALWFGNWVVTGFSIVLLSQRAKSIPQALHDSARMDGLGAIGTARHAIFPLVRRDLGLIALFTVMATLLPFWAFINLSDALHSFVLFHRASSPAEQVGLMVAGSLTGALPLIAIFFVAKRRT